MSHSRFPLLLAALFFLAPAKGGAATQSIPLKPGWNSVWLTVDPADSNPVVVFAGVPVAQVWRWFPTESPVEFIDNPANGLFNADGWRGYFPETQANSFCRTSRRSRCIGLISSSSTARRVRADRAACDFRAHHRRHAAARFQWRGAQGRPAFRLSLDTSLRTVDAGAGKVTAMNLQMTSDLFVGGSGRHWRAVGLPGNRDGVVIRRNTAFFIERPANATEVIWKR